MNDLVTQVEKNLDKKIPSTHLPYWMGMMGGYCFPVRGYISKQTTNGKHIFSNIYTIRFFC